MIVNPNVTWCVVNIDQGLLPDPDDAVKPMMPTGSRIVLRRISPYRFMRGPSLSLRRFTWPLVLSALHNPRQLRLACAMPSSESLPVKDLWVLRHGQATHNPRAEAARAAGCTFEEFFELMRQDDSVDSPLTPLGLTQAEQVRSRHGARLREVIQLVVSSPLSRALQTADTVLPPHVTEVIRISREEFREINGELYNAQRRTVTALKAGFSPQWSWDSLLTDHDEMWTPILESIENCAERGYQGLNWLYHDRPETRILLVSHGGLLRYTMINHPRVMVHDGRHRGEAIKSKFRDVQTRFENCELRRYRVSWDSKTECIILTEVDIDSPLDGYR